MSKGTFKVYMPDKYNISIRFEGDEAVINYVEYFTYLSAEERRKAIETTAVVVNTLLNLPKLIPIQPPIPIPQIDCKVETGTDYVKVEMKGKKGLVMTTLLNELLQNLSNEEIIDLIGMVSASRKLLSMISKILVEKS
jgi:molybdenum cofactor biosynthesis enzyme